MSDHPLSHAHQATCATCLAENAPTPRPRPDPPAPPRQLPAAATTTLLDSIERHLAVYPTLSPNQLVHHRLFGHCPRCDGSAPVVNLHAQPGRWRVVYTGSRILTDRDAVWADLDAILEQHPLLLVRYGACGKGGDLFVEQWARQRRTEGHDVILDPRPAPWDRLSRIAGPMRNAYMIGLGADEVLAHIHPESKTQGAAGCAEFADWAGIPVRPRAVR